MGRHSKPEDLVEEGTGSFEMPAWPTMEWDLPAFPAEVVERLAEPVSSRHRRPGARGFSFHLKLPRLPKVRLPRIEKLKKLRWYDYALVAVVVLGTIAALTMGIAVVMGPG
jgi:hypothetical protein